jgi:hypothetical protein
MSRSMSETFGSAGASCAEDRRFAPPLVLIRLAGRRSSGSGDGEAEWGTSSSSEGMSERGEPGDSIVDAMSSTTLKGKLEE